jgi:hypothetical protein
LLQQTDFSDLYNSANSIEMRGQQYDLLVCSAARAEKWKANQDPAADAAHIESLVSILSTVKAREAVLISTVDVFPSPIQVDEATPIDVSAQNAYGKHRYQLERFFEEHFPVSLIVRLPALFGRGLKKNAVYDILHGNQVEKIHPDSTFQFYNLENLWPDIQVARENGLHLVHFSVEPVSMRRVAEEGLGIPLVHTPSNLPASYDFKSRYTAIWNQSNGYLYSADQTIEGLRRFEAGFEKGKQ